MFANNCRAFCWHQEKRMPHGHNCLQMFLWLLVFLLWPKIQGNGSWAEVASALTRFNTNDGRNSFIKLFWSPDRNLVCSGRVKAQKTLEQFWVIVFLDGGREVAFFGFFFGPRRQSSVQLKINWNEAKKNGKKGSPIQEKRVVLTVFKITQEQTRTNKNIWAAKNFDKTLFQGPGARNFIRFAPPHVWWARSQGLPATVPRWQKFNSTEKKLISIWKYTSNSS